MPYIIAIIAVIIIGVGFTLLQPTKPAPTPATPQVSTTPAVQPATEAQTNQDYVDGTYTTEVTYFTPKRDEYGVSVSLTLTKDIITDVKVTYSQGAENDRNVARFEAAYKSQVIGKDIDTLNLSRVGGASLTTAAFNNALTNIKADAKS